MGDELGQAEEEVGVRSVLSFTAWQQLKQGDVIIAHCAPLITNVKLLLVYFSSLNKIRGQMF